MGIKSFQGARKDQQSTEDIPFKVSDFMSKNLITFRPEQSIEEVIDSLINNKISGGPVVNDKNELVGIISEGDCIKHISESRYYNMPPEDDKIENRAAQAGRIASNPGHLYRSLCAGGYQDPAGHPLCQLQHCRG